MKRLFLSLLALCFACGAWALPRAEYPRPQFERQDWLNLNGDWTYAFDFVGSGMEKRFFESKGFQGYTQLTDVEQEQNGIYSYDRTSKFDMARIKAIFSKRPVSSK